MITRGRGSIVNISTMYAVVAPDPRLYEGTDFLNPPGYSAAKAATLSFTRYVASFWGRYGIRANAILPGPFSNTEDVTANSVDESDPFLDRLASRTSLGRRGRPDELAGRAPVPRVRRLLVCHRARPDRGRGLDGNVTTLAEELAAHVEAVRATVARSSDVIDAIVTKLCDCFEHGGKLLICGNGGSAADAQHLAAEFMNRMRIDRGPWPAIALSTDTSVLTSIANDSAYDDVFARQVEALGRPGDVLIAISTSGGAANILAAIRAGRKGGLVTVGFTGEAGVESMGKESDLLLAVPSRETARIQECHEFVYHVIAGMVERQLVDRDARSAIDK